MITCTNENISIKGVKVANEMFYQINADNLFGKYKMILDAEELNHLIQSIETIKEMAKVIRSKQ